MSSVIEVLKGIRPEFDFATSEDFIADGMLDSFDVITLISELDKRYSISILGTDILPENIQERRGDHGPLEEVRDRAVNFSFAGKRMAGVLAGAAAQTSAASWRT